MYSIQFLNVRFTDWNSPRVPYIVITVFLKLLSPNHRVCYISLERTRHGVIGIGIDGQFKSRNCLFKKMELELINLELELKFATK